jgi:Putative glucoamylase
MDPAGRCGRSVASSAFFDYVARGVPYGPDDGTIAPWAVVASLPFAPEIVLPTVLHFKEVYPQITGKYCFKCSFNLTFPHESQGKSGWTSPYHYGINYWQAGSSSAVPDQLLEAFDAVIGESCDHLIAGSEDVQTAIFGEHADRD